VVSQIREATINHESIIAKWHDHQTGIQILSRPVHRGGDQGGESNSEATKRARGLPVRGDVSLRTKTSVPNSNRRADDAEGRILRLAQDEDLRRSGVNAPSPVHVSPIHRILRSHREEQLLG
jgi:hypothetical protein